MAFGIEAFNAAGGLLFDSNATCYRVVETGRSRLTVWAGKETSTAIITTISRTSANFNIVLVRPPIGFAASYQFAAGNVPDGSIVVQGRGYAGQYVDYIIIRRVSDYGGSGVSHGIRAHAPNGRVTFDSGYRYPTLTASYNIKTIAHTEVNLPHSHASGVYVVLNPFNIAHLDINLDVFTWWMSVAWLNQTRVRMGPVQFRDRLTGGNIWHLPSSDYVRHYLRTTACFMRVTG